MGDDGGEGFKKCSKLNNVIYGWPLTNYCLNLNSKHSKRAIQLFRQSFVNTFLSDKNRNFRTKQSVEKVRDIKVESSKVDTRVRHLDRQKSELDI